MSYFASLTIQPETTVASPASVEIPIAPGILKKVIIEHPTGCSYLVGVWIEYQAVRLYPQNDSGYFLGNGNPITFSPNHPLIEPPFELRVLGYNTDDTYTHQITVMFDIEHLGSFAARQAALLSFFGGGLMSLPGG